jgi:hypothetical protein
MDRAKSCALYRVVISGVRRPFGGRAGGWPCLLCLIWTGRGTVDREITVPNLFYYSNFSYYYPPMWLCGEWQSRWLPMEVCRRLFDPSNLPWAVNQCPFDPYRAGAKVYRAYQAGGRAARPTNNLGTIHGYNLYLTSYISYLTNYGQNVELWTFWVTMVTFTCVILWINR